jgi:cytochrome c oxidase cbb3-type subunit 2
MPSYPWLEKTPLPTNSIQDRMRALQRLGVPYSDADIAKAPEQLSGKTEEDAMVAYLQELGLNRRNVRLESTASAAPPSPSEAAGPAASSKE